jgi:hypothetical protein
MFQELFNEIKNIWFEQHLSLKLSDQTFENFLSKGNESSPPQEKVIPFLT